MLLSLFLLLACPATTISTDPTCTLDTPVLAPESAAPGDEVVATVRPLTEVWDTALTVGSARAELVEVDRSTCVACDDCRETEECDACEDCDSCDEACAPCVETVRFVVPDLVEGPWSVEIANRHGRSGVTELTVLPAPTL